MSTKIDLDDGTASLDPAFSVANYFELDNKQALKIASEVAKATAKWKQTATKLGVPAAGIERMTSAFEHEDLNAVLRQK